MGEDLVGHVRCVDFIIEGEFYCLKIIVATINDSYKNQH